MASGHTVHAHEVYKAWLKYRGVRFIDVTDTQTHASPQRAVTYPDTMQHDARLRQAFAYASEAGPRSDLVKFTSFFTRYYRSRAGWKSQKWLQSRIEHAAASLAANTTVEEFQHPWPQSSLILRVHGANASLTHERGVTIIGAHQDSVNLLPVFAAPGADDDGSGTATLLEVIRALGHAQWRPASDVEFHFYAAEEAGLLGSQAVADAYAARGTRVYAMLQMDMTAYVKQGTEERLGVVTDFVSPALTSFIERLAAHYVRIPVVRTELHYGASDHASWTRAGQPSAFVIEAYVHLFCSRFPHRPFEDCNVRHIHTSLDRYDAPGFSFAHLLRFVHLGMAFVAELAGWTGVEEEIIRR